MAKINIRAKGAEGEREVIRMLTPIIKEVMKEMDFAEELIRDADQMVQRNQNQSAVGGCDLTNVFGIAVEVKRQETLSVNTWWKQCVTSAQRNNELPLLIYRKNRQAWRIRTFGFLHVPHHEGGWTGHQSVIELEEEDFKSWFKQWVRAKILTGHEVKI